MSLLTSARSHARLDESPESLSARWVRANTAAVAIRLEHSAWDIRWGAANALGNARAGSAELRARLPVERNRYVLAELCDALAAARDEAALPLLRRFARKQYWPLVRGSALLAVSAIEGQPSVAFLKERLKRDPSPRVKYLAHCALAELGSTDSVGALRRALASADPRVRELVANTLASCGRLSAPLRKALKERAAREAAP